MIDPDSPDPAALLRYCRAVVYKRLVRTRRLTDEEESAVGLAVALSLRKWDRGRPDGASLPVYAAAAAVNTVRRVIAGQHLGRTRYGVWVNTFSDLGLLSGENEVYTELLAVPDPGTAALRSAAVSDDVRAAIGRLPRGQRVVVRMLYGFDGPPVTTTEAAGLLGITKQAVSMRHVKAVRELGRMLGRVPPADQPEIPT